LNAKRLLQDSVPSQRLIALAHRQVSRAEGDRSAPPIARPLLGGSGQAPRHHDLTANVSTAGGVTFCGNVDPHNQVTTVVVQYGVGASSAVR
jgi:hypothetical protein